MSMLAQTWLFAELNATELERLSAAAFLLELPAGQLLFSLGDPTPGLHLIHSGSVKLYTLTSAGDERIIDLIGPGEFCGEMGVIDGAPSSAWGQTMEPTCLWVIPPHAFEGVLMRDPVIGLKVCRVLVSKLRATSRQLDETLFLPARERVLRNLMRLVQRHGRPSPGGTLVAVRLTHQEVARLAGTARETVSRVLAELQDRGLLRFTGKQMLFADPAALRELAGVTRD